MPKLIYFITKKTKRMCYLKDNNSDYILQWREKQTTGLDKGYLSNDISSMKKYHPL